MELSFCFYSRAPLGLPRILENYQLLEELELEPRSSVRPQDDSLHCILRKIQLASCTQVSSLPTGLRKVLKKLRAQVWNRTTWVQVLAPQYTKL